MHHELDLHRHYRIKMCDNGIAAITPTRQKITANMYYSSRTRETQIKYDFSDTISAFVSKEQFKTFIVT